MKKPPTEVPPAQAQLDGLRQQIKRTEAELIARLSNDKDNASDEMAVLFTGNWHDSIPRRLIFDEMMTPTEKHLWMVIRCAIKDASKPGAVPNRAELARYTNISNTTVTTCREVLRVNRWTTHCRTVRQKGRFVGDIYLLHDEPLSLASTLEIDPGYIEFLERLVNGASKTTRVRQMAAQILREIDAMNTPVVPPTETKVMADRILYWQFKIAPGQDDLTPTSHQEQNLTLAGKTKDSRKLRLSNHSAYQDQNLTSADAGQKVTQEQNLTLVAGNVGSSRKARISAGFLANSGQGEKLTSVVGGESDQGEFLTPAVISSLCFSSSSLNKLNNTNAHMREDANRPQTISTATQSPSQHTEVSSHSDHSHSGWNSDKAWDDVFDEEPILPDLLELQQLITRHLPDISSPCLARYQRALLATRQSQIPQLARILRPLAKNKRRNVLFQLLAKAASEWHGWSQKPLGNAVAYCKTLADLAQNDSLQLDDYALELMRCADANRTPYFESTIDRLAELQQMDKASKDVPMVDNS